MNFTLAKRVRALVATSIVIVSMGCNVGSQLSAQSQAIPDPFDDFSDATVSQSDVADENGSKSMKDSSEDPTGIAGEPGQSIADLNQAGADDPNEEPEGQAVEQMHPAGQASARPERNVAPAKNPVDWILAKRFEHALLIDVRGPIFGWFHWYLNHRLDMAKQRGVDLVILNLTSPGGDLEYSLELARRLRDVDWATTIVFVPEEAISGGAIISLGADRIYMQSGALIGDAGPIRMGADGQFEHAEEKIVSYLAEAIRELAEAKGRPGALAQAMVDRNLSVYEWRDPASGELRFVTKQEAEADALELGPPVPETGQNRFLTVAADRAVELRLAESVFETEDDLFRAMQIDQVSRTAPTWIDSLVFMLNRPWFTALLLVCGLIGLYLELAAPGISVAGLSSMCCFGVFFWSHVLGGTSGWLEVLLFVLGVGCVICEMFVLPGFGVFGITGVFLVILSLVMASQDFVLPESPDQWNQLRWNLLVVLGSVLGVLLLFFGQLMLLDSLPGLSRLQLSTPEEPAGGPQAGDAATPTFTRLTQTSNAAEAVEAQYESLAVGTIGVAESDLRPSGKILVGSRLIDVISEGSFVDAGSPVEIVKIEGNRIIARKRNLS